MPISFSCAICQKPVKVNDAAAGKRVRCSACGTVQVVPAPAAPAAAANPAPVPPPVPQAPARPTRARPAARPAVRRRPVYARWDLWLGLAALFVVGTACLVAFLLFLPAPVWVEEFKNEESPRERNAGVGVSYYLEANYERSGQWVVLLDLQGNYLEAWATEGGRPDSVAEELKEAAQDMPAVSAMIRAGWIPKGCSAVRVSRNGNGVEAAKFQFSPKAHQVVVDSAAIKKAKEHRN